MGKVPILVKQPETKWNILFYLMHTPYEIWVQSEKKMFRYVCDSPKGAALGDRSALHLVLI